MPPKNRTFAEYVKCASTVRSIDETLMQLNTVESIGNIKDDLKQVRRMAEEQFEALYTLKKLAKSK